jgi:hypothetical protein
MSQDYVRAFAGLIASGDESMGYHLPVKTITTRRAPPVVPSAASSEAVNFSISTPFLNSALVVHRPSALSTFSYNTSTFPCCFAPLAANAGIQLAVGSERFPYSRPINTAAELIKYNVKEQNELADVHAGSSIVSLRTAQDGGAYSGMCSFYQNFHSLVGTETEKYEFERIDTSAIGSVVQYQQNLGNASTSVSQEALGIFEHTRVVSLVGGVVRVRG